MIVFCEECGQRNIIDPENLDGPPKCSSCKDILRLPAQVQKTIDIRVNTSTMELRFKKKQIELSVSRPTLSLGRQRYNDIVVEDNRVSRSHARFEMRENTFILIDQSTNGTYVFIKGKKGMNLRQDELPLNGEGFIGLGKKVASNSPDAIHFSIKQ